MIMNLINIGNTMGIDVKLSKNLVIKPNSGAEFVFGTTFINLG